MTPSRTTTLATLLVVTTGSLWGFYWLPVRRLADLGLPGAWGTLAIVAAAALGLAPFALAGRRRLARSSPVALASTALGGVAFVLYSTGLVYGKVAIVVLLFFLTPVWSTLLARYVMGWSTPWLRLVAIAVGVVGLVCVLSADGGLPVPRGLGDWLGLASGVLWAVATTGIRARSDTGPGESAFVFALGGCLCAGVLAPLLAPWPNLADAAVLPALALAAGAGAFWWGLSMAALMWAAARLEPARVGILLMAEVLLGTASAALLAGETVGALELLGGALVLAAGVLEVWPVRDNAPAPGRTGARGNLPAEK
ncbi:EamA family transporter [Rhodovibrio sodomensis]|uniref:EamA family transporter n=1 Tax=Rhodovibrio sodomensis TaxID=1088 RepID=A0ABS1DBN5_9PROT|nr:DMT family transporter [Rhodovibrio sodomensis]MBK1667869.1 EamA family transporter [Rhodovibrio sodomensis]